MQIGRLNLKNRLMLAPMAMYSDAGFFRLCYEYGCAYSFTEQIYAAEFIKKTAQIQRKIDIFQKGGIQFITNSSQELKEAIKIINEKQYEGLDKISSIDLNLGCPTNTVIKKNLGAAILKNPKLTRELFSAMRTSTNLPISAKIRLALNAKHKKTKPYLRIAKIAQEEGLDFITVHARNAGQMYSGNVDLSALQEIKNGINIPLIGNGGICDVESANSMMKICDAIMIGQHALKEPFIFKQILEPKWRFNYADEKKKCITKYLQYADEYNTGFQHIKIHLQSLLKGLLGNEKTISLLTHTKNKDDIKKIIKKTVNIT